MAGVIDDLRHIDTAVLNGSPTLFATDGTSLYRLFSNSSSFVPQTIKTKLWDMGDPLADKQVLKIGLEVVFPPFQQNITGTLDTEAQPPGVPFSFTSANYVYWVNNSGAVVQWVNNSGAIVEWLASGYLFFAQDIQSTGRYVGVTLYGNSVGTTFAGLHLQYEMRAQWPQGGPM